MVFPKAKLILNFFLVLLVAIWIALLSSFISKSPEILDISDVEKLQNSETTNDQPQREILTDVGDTNILEFKEKKLLEKENIDHQKLLLNSTMNNKSENLTKNNNINLADMEFISPILMKWTIDINDTTNNGNDDKNSFKSTTFNSRIPGLQYHLRIDNLKKIFYSQKIINFRICLIITQSMFTTLKTEFSIFIKSGEFKKEIYKSYYLDESEEDEICENVEILEKDEKLIVNEKLNIKLEGNIQAQGLKLYSRKQSSFVSDILKNEDNYEKKFRFGERYFIKIFAENKLIKTHSEIIKQRASHFADYIGGWSNIALYQFSYDIVKIAIDYCYDKNIQENITESNVSELFKFADRFKMHSLKKTLETILIQKLSIENVVQFSNLAVTYKLQILREYSIYFLINLSHDKIVHFQTSENLNEEICYEIFNRIYRVHAQTENDGGDDDAKNDDEKHEPTIKARMWGP